MQEYNFFKLPTEHEGRRNTQVNKTNNSVNFLNMSSVRDQECIPFKK